MPNPFDPLKADVISVHLHMTSAEAIAVLEQRFGVKFAEEGPCFKTMACTKSQDSKLTMGKKFVSGVTMVTKQFELYLSFNESYPFDPSHPEILTSIAYRPVMTTSEDKNAFFEEAVKKYGKPSSPDIPNGSSQLGGAWCALGMHDTFTRPARYRCDESSNYAPVPQVRNGGVFVHDFSIALDNQKRWDARKTVAPPL